MNELKSVLNCSVLDNRAVLGVVMKLSPKKIKMVWKADLSPAKIDMVWRLESSLGEIKRAMLSHWSADRNINMV